MNPTMTGVFSESFEAVCADNERLRAEVSRLWEQYAERESEITLLLNVCGDIRLKRAILARREGKR